MCYNAHYPMCCNLIKCFLVVSQSSGWMHTAPVSAPIHIYVIFFCLTYDAQLGGVNLGSVFISKEMTPGLS